MANEDVLQNEIQNGAGPEPVTRSEKSRGSFDLRSKRSGTGPNKKMYLGVAGIILLFFTVVIVGWSLLINKMQEGSTQIDESQVEADVSLQVDKGNDESMAAAKAEKVRLMKEQEQREQREKEQKEHQSSGQPGSTPNTSAPAVQTPPASAGPPPLTPAQRKLSGGLVITPSLQDVSASGAMVAGDTGQSNRTGDAPSRQPSSLADRDSGTADAAGLGVSRNRGSLSNLSGTSFAPSKAVLAPSRKYLLTHNTYTRCALYTEIDTDHPGLIDCRLTEPLYSADGSTVIADAGDRLTGEQSIELKAGQARVFTAWTELETQSGVRAKLDSLGAGPMGASGTEAWIDNHYKERFGGAVMLSVIQDVLQAAANTTQNSGGSGYTVNNSEQNVENMASKALENTINIGPTGHIFPGTVMTVIVARDIDFSSVFENH